MTKSNLNLEINNHKINNSNNNNYVNKYGDKNINEDESSSKEQIDN